MKLLWEYGVVESSNKFETGCILHSDARGWRFDVSDDLHCVSKKFTLLLFEITKSDVDRFQ